MEKLNEKGFGFWELLLLLLLILILIALGWWVWKQKGNNKPADSGQQQSQPKQEQKPAAEKPQETAKKYLEIKELGIKMELGDSTTDAYYIMKNGYAYISTTSLKTADAECGADKTGVVAIGKYAKTDVDEQSGKTYGDLATASGAVIGNDAYYMSRSQAYCSQDAGIQAKQQAAWDGFKAEAKTIQAL